MNSLITDTDIRERLLERPPAEQRLSERTRTSRDRDATIKRPTFMEVLAASGAIIVVSLGMGFVFVITLVSLGTLPDEQKTAVVTTAFTVLGTIVGAYFGVKVGAAGKEKAEKAREAEAVRVQELAAHVDPVVALSALDRAHRRIEHRNP
jgi:hypothetical protein